MSPFLFNRNHFSATPTPRESALSLLASFFEAWQSSWKATKNTFPDLALSESSLRRLNFYESEQKKSIISSLASILSAWENTDSLAFSREILSLARELRPSLAYFESDEGDNFTLSESQLSRLHLYMESVATSLKSTVSALQALTPALDPDESPLTPHSAETLLREKLGLSFFDFIDFDSEPRFRNGYFPELLQDSSDFGF